MTISFTYYAIQDLVHMPACLFIIKLLMSPNGFLQSPTNITFRKDFLISFTTVNTRMAPVIYDLVWSSLARTAATFFFFEQRPPLKKNDSSFMLLFRFQEGVSNHENQCVRKPTTS